MDKDVCSSCVTCRCAGLRADALSLGATDGPYQDVVAAAVILKPGASIRGGVLIDN
jgi:hypothetical protein